MSSNYMLVSSSTYEPVKMYGFQKVSKAQMMAITERLQRNTYNSELYFGELYQRLPSPPRPPSTFCRKLDERQDTFGSRQWENINDEDLARIVRRLHSPKSSAKDTKSKKRKEERPNSQRTTRTYDREREKEMVEQLSRHTESSRDKLTLRYAEEPAVIAYNQRNAPKSRCDTRMSQQELDDIVQRVRMETVASRTQKLPLCKKMPSMWKRRLMETEYA